MPFCLGEYGQVLIIFGDLLESFSNFDDNGIRYEVMICAIVFFGIAAAQYLIQYGMSWGYAESGELIVERLRAALFRSMMRQNAAFFDDPEHSTGALLSMLGVDCGYAAGDSNARKCCVTGGDHCGTRNIILCFMANVSVTANGPYYQCCQCTC